MTEQAVTDLRYLGQRLKGILEIVPLLEKLDSLTDHVSQMEEVLQKQKAEYATRKAAFDALDKDEAAFEKKSDEVLKKAKDQAAGIIQKASTDYEAMIKEAKEEVSDIFETATKVARQKDDEVKVLLARKDILVNEIDKYSKQLSELKTELENLKKRF